LIDKPMTLTLDEAASTTKSKRNWFFASAILIQVIPW
jgi:hypothetical protein